MVEEVDAYNVQKTSFVGWLGDCLVIGMKEKEVRFKVVLKLVQLKEYLIVLDLQIGRRGLMSWSISKFTL